MTITADFNVPAPMRDGTVLRANVFRPAQGGPYPVALCRTPYGKDFASVGPFLDAVRLARAGYIVVVQDVRGRFSSDGAWLPFQHEAQDGFDTVEWAAGLPGATGRVGMYGESYLGFTQWAAAGQAPPHLGAIVPGITWADGRDGVSWRGGALELGLAAFWNLNALAFDTLLKRHAAAPPAEKMGAVAALVTEINRLRTEGYSALPLKDFEPLQRLDLFASHWADLFARPYQRQASAVFSPVEIHERVRAPAFNVGGWYDIFCNGALQNFAGLRQKGATPEARQSRLLVGPWSHGGLGHVVGERDFGFGAQLAFINLQTDMTGLTQRWFDYWLKGVDNGVAQEPPVRLFIMGDDVWRDEHEWPLARTEYTPVYLRAQGGLSLDPPGAEPPDHFVYDPADPAPSLGGALLMNPLFHPGVADQRPIESRGDVLVYTGAPLDREVEATGPVTARLWAASDGPDTDFVVRLVDVHPDGFAQNLTDGILRARYRTGEAAELLTPGRVYEFTIDLWATAHVFKPGHRIRVDVTSASFPRWDRNPNTGRPFGLDEMVRPARQTIRHDAAHPSHVVLPIIPR